jgi:hypothetical protein
MRLLFCFLGCAILHAGSSSVRAEGIDRPSPELLRFIRSADQVFIFPNRTPLKPHRDDRHLRVLPPEPRRKLVALLSRQRTWLDGWDNSVYAGDPEAPDMGLLFRRGTDELVMFFFCGNKVQAIFNGQRQPTRWTFQSFKAIVEWQKRYAQPEFTE